MINKLLEDLSSKLEGNSTIKKYNQLLHIDTLQITGYKNGLNSFSWGRYCVYISKFSKEKRSIDLNLLYGIELIGLAARLIDDALDKDSLIFEKSSTEYLFLLASELQIEAFNILSNYSLFDFTLLHIALQAEYKDYSATLNDEHLSVDFYFEQILPKSSAIFHLFTKLIGGNNSYLNDFAIHYGNYIQIKNDLSDFEDDLAADIHTLRCTLPLLSSVATSNKVINEEILYLLNNSYNPCSIRSKVIATGAIAFSRQLMEKERVAAISALTDLNQPELTTEFKTYLRLE